jgi:hypothetical protein
MTTIPAETHVAALVLDEPSWARVHEENNVLFPRALALEAGR